MGLFFVLVGDEEMILIGREADVRERLQYGTGNILAEHHQIAGKWLNDLYELRDANWLASIDSLYHAALDLYRCRKNQKTSIDESIAAAEEQRVWQEFLKDKIASGHPVNQYMALRIETLSWFKLGIPSKKRLNEAYELLMLLSNSLFSPAHVAPTIEDSRNNKETAEQIYATLGMYSRSKKKRK